MPKLPEGLPLIRVECPRSAWTFGAGEAFWDGLDERVGALGLDEILDLALAGRTAPRVWVLAYEPGRPEPAVAGALGLARALAQRGQAALVVDGDDQSCALSRWAGRAEIEGWVDVVRYGTSVVASAVPLPFAGRTCYLMGVGSYAPTDATAAEVAQLLARLRHQADDLLVVMPAGAGTAVWGPLANLRIYCHNLADPEERLASDVAVLSGGGFAPTSLLGLGEPAAAPVAPEAGTTEPAAEPAVETASPGDGPEAAAAGGDRDAEAAGAVPPEPAPEPATAAESEPVAAPSAAAADRDRDADADAYDEPAARAAVSATLDELSTRDPFSAFAREEDEEEDTRIGGTSGVFWLIAVVAVIAIAVVTVYYVKFVRVTEQDLFGDAPLEVVRDDLPPPAWTVPPTDSTQAGLQAADSAAADTGAAGTLLAAGPDSLPAAAVTPDSTPTVGADTEIGGEATESPDQASSDAADTAAAPETAPPSGGTATDGGFDPAPYAVPVGQDGWALQVYAFRDSSSAAVETALLERRGLRAAARPVEVAGKGVWWRVYVGSFASRAEARRAMPALYEKLRIDWANPTRFAQ